MRNLWSCITNGEYKVGCSGSTVYVYSKYNEELAKFKDLKFACESAISPKGDIFVVKSTNGWLAVYSLEKLCLIKKFRFSKVDCSQDDNFCFSPDGELFYNIERHNASTQSALSIYRTSDFSLVKRVFSDEPDTFLNCIEYDGETNNYYILGFFRNGKKLNSYFVSKLYDDALKDIRTITELDWWYYSEYKSLEMCGFTKKAKAMSEIVGYSFIEPEDLNISLAKLWRLSEAEFDRNSIL